MKYKNNTTKPYAPNQTKEELKGIARRLKARVAALETHINHVFLGIKRSLRDFEKSKEYNKEKHSKTHVWCVVEELQIITFEKPIYGPEPKKVLFFKGDKDKPGKVFDSELEAENELDENDEVIDAYETKYYNVVNIFLSKLSAENHLKKYREKYHNPKVVSMFPLENEELEQIRNHFYYLGENLPDFQSIWEENEKLRNNKNIIEILQGDIEEKRKIISDLMKKLDHAGDVLKEATERNKHLCSLIEVKKNERKKRKD